MCINSIFLKFKEFLLQLIVFLIYLILNQELLMKAKKSSILTLLLLSFVMFLFHMMKIKKFCTISPLVLKKAKQLLLSGLQDAVNQLF